MNYFVRISTQAPASRSMRSIQAAFMLNYQNNYNKESLFQYLLRLG
jgi:hypothetical protein